jgi:hypothetical protein
MIKMEVGPVSAIAWYVAILSAFKFFSMGVPNNARAVAAIGNWGICYFKRHDLNVTTVAVSSLQGEEAEFMKVGSKDNEVVENTLLHL